MGSRSCEFCFIFTNYFVLFCFHLFYFVLIAPNSLQVSLKVENTWMRIEKQRTHKKNSNGSPAHLLIAKSYLINLHPTFRCWGRALSPSPLFLNLPTGGISDKSQIQFATKARKIFSSGENIESCRKHRNWFFIDHSRDTHIFHQFLCNLLDCTVKQAMLLNFNSHNFHFSAVSLSLCTLFGKWKLQFKFLCLQIIANCNRATLFFYYLFISWKFKSRMFDSKSTNLLPTVFQRTIPPHQIIFHFRSDDIN